MRYASTVDGKVVSFERMESVMCSKSFWISLDFAEALKIGEKKRNDRYIANWRTSRTNEFSMSELIKSFRLGKSRNSFNDTGLRRNQKLTIKDSSLLF